MAPRRLTPWRITGAVVTLLLVAVTAKLWLDGARWKRDFDRWIIETPLDIPVDLSHSGEYTAAFHQTCEVAHAQQLRLTVDPPTFDPGDPALATLHAEFTVVDTSGKVILRSPVVIQPAEPVIYEAPPGELLLLREIMGPNGVHQVTLTVKTGVAALAGIPQRLIIRNELCGLERLPGVLLHWIAAAAAFFAACTGVPTALSLAKTHAGGSPSPASPSVGP